MEGLIDRSHVDERQEDIDHPLSRRPRESSPEECERLDDWGYVCRFIAPSRIADRRSFISRTRSSESIGEVRIAGLIPR